MIETIEELELSLTEKTGFEEEDKRLQAMCSHPDKYLDEFIFIASHNVPMEDGDQGDLIQECIVHFINTHPAEAFAISRAVDESMLYASNWIQDAITLKKDPKRTKEFESNICDYINLCVVMNYPINKQNGILYRAIQFMYHRVVLTLIINNLVVDNERKTEAFVALCHSHRWDIAKRMIDDTLSLQSWANLDTVITDIDRKKYRGNKDFMLCRSFVDKETDKFIQEQAKRMKESKMIVRTVKFDNEGKLID